MTLAIGTAFVEAARPAPALAAFATAIAPAAAIAVIRFAVFGTAMPLAVLAKPSSLDAGLLYAARAFLFTGLPFLVVSRALRQIERRALAVLVACFVHFVSMALAGGDWMPLFRLAVPILPGLAWVGAAVAERSRRELSWLRFALA